MNEEELSRAILDKRQRLIHNSDVKYLEEFANEYVPGTESPLTKVRTSRGGSIPPLGVLEKTDKTGYAILLILSLLVLVVALVTLVLFLRPSVINDNTITEVQQVYPTVVYNTTNEVVKRTEVVAPPGNPMICIDNPDSRVRTCYPQ